MLTQFKVNLTKFKKYIFPDRCVICKAYPDLLCENCISKMTYCNSICHVCKTATDNFSVHDNCKKQTVMSNCYVCFNYSKSIEKLVVTLKFHFIEDMAEMIASLMFQSGRVPNFENYIIIPIPLHRKRENRRGFNQSELIANCLVNDSERHPPERTPLGQPPQAQSGLRGSQKGMLVLKKIVKLLKRTKERKPQLGKNKHDRMSNNLGIFEVDKKAASNFPQNQELKFLLVDDICTTGATLESAAIELKKYWPNASISSLVFARG